MVGGVTVPSEISVVLSIWRARCRALWNSIVRAPWQRRLGYAFLALFGGLYLFAYARLVATRCRVEGDPSAFLVRSFRLTFIFLLFYAISFALQRLSGDDDLKILASLPVSRRVLFAVKFVDIAWDLLRIYVLAAPLFVGAALAVRPSWGRWALYFASGALLWAFVTGVGMAFAQMVSRRFSYPRRWVGIFRLASTLALFGVMIWLMLVRSAAGEKEVQSDIVPSALPSGWALLVPTTWVYGVLVSSAPWGWVGGQAFISGGVLFLVLRAFIAWFDVERATAGDPPGRRHYGSRVSRRRSVLTALVLKEWRLLVRNPTQLATWLSSLAILVLFARFSGLGSNRLEAVAFSGFFVSIVGLQLVGVERDRILLLRAVLGGMGRLLVAKALLTAAILLPISLAFAANWDTRTVRGDHLVLAMLLTVGYATFSVGIGGAVAPHFRAQNPTRSVRLPAIFALYVYFLFTIIPAVWYEREGPLIWSIYGGVALVGIAMLVLGAHRLSHREIL